MFQFNNSDKGINFVNNKKVTKSYQKLYYLSETLVADSHILYP